MNQTNPAPDAELLLPPENFSLVDRGIYRSAFPRAKNQLFLLKLGIRSIIPLVPEDYPQVMIDFCQRHGILLLKYGVDGNKWPFKEIDDSVLHNALATIMHSPGSNSSVPSYSATCALQGFSPQPQLVASSQQSVYYDYRPCLIHCNKGKHRTGSLIGCIRKLAGWSMSSIVAEYTMFASPKPRIEDQMFIEAFNPKQFLEHYQIELPVLVVPQTCQPGVILPPDDLFVGDAQSVQSNLTAGDAQSGQEAELDLLITM
jgi:tyrosine-protein phosphatase SIW14